MDFYWETPYKNKSPSGEGENPKASWAERGLAALFKCVTRGRKKNGSRRTGVCRFSGNTLGWSSLGGTASQSQRRFQNNHPSPPAMPSIANSTR